MKEDYLWDRTGDDPEIKRLENVLSVFKYQESAAPALPAAEVTPSAEKEPRWKFSFAFAFAGCVAVVVLLSVWFQISSRQNVSEQGLAVIAPPQINNEPRNEPVINKTDGVVKVDAENLTARRGITNVRRSFKFNNRRNKKTDRSSEDSAAIAALTKEEKYAYEQLMLALSITGSKLKIVKDTINGIEGSEGAVTKNER